MLLLTSAGWDRALRVVGHYGSIFSKNVAAATLVCLLERTIVVF